MFKIDDAVQAYRASAYQGIEYDLESRIAGAGLPVFGGFVGGVKSFANAVARPFRVTGSFIFGGPADPSAVEKTPIPTDIAGKQYGKDMEALRANLRERADCNAEAVGHFCSGDFQKGFRQWSAADHQTARSRILMPEDADPKSGLVSSLVAGVAAGAISGVSAANPSEAPSPGLPRDLPPAPPTPRTLAI